MSFRGEYNRIMKEIRINDRDPITLWMFSTRVERLHSIVKGWSKGSSISCKLRTTSPSELKTTGISTDIRLSASLNELRPFMLKNERTYFPTVRSLVSSWYRDDKQIQVHLDNNKAFWRSYDINEMNAANNARMQVCFSVAGKEIVEYKMLLQCFMYGKYFHDDKVDLFLAETLIENNSLYYATAKAELQSCIYLLQTFLKEFDRTYIKPVLKENSSRIQAFKKMVVVE